MKVWQSTNPHMMRSDDMNASRVELGCWPTPLTEAANISHILGEGRKLYIKRDDLCGIAFGGNKIRRLEYQLSDALQAGCDCIVTGGSSTSNQTCAVAACGAKLGLETHVVYPEATPTATRRLCQMARAVSHIARARASIAKRTFGDGNAGGG